MPKQTILVAEDDETFRRDVGRFLQKQGYGVICVEDGYQAVEFSLKDTPDLLLLDVHMPGGDGFSVHERLAKHPELALTPVIYMTHDPSREIEVAAEKDGAVTLLHKPFELDELLGVIRQALGTPAADAA